MIKYFNLIAGIFSIYFLMESIILNTPVNRMMTYLWGIYFSVIHIVSFYRVKTFENQIKKQLEFYNSDEGKKALEEAEKLQTKIQTFLDEEENNNESK